MTVHIQLRATIEEDLDVLYEHQRDPEAARMAAFVPYERGVFVAHWLKILHDDAITKRSVLLDGEVVGHVAQFRRNGAPEVTYWIDRKHWGRGIATRALKMLLEEVDTRPLHARAAVDNPASIRVLEKCGFREVGREEVFALARGGEIEEVVMELR